MKDYSTLPNTSGSFPDVVATDASGPGETDGTPLKKQVVDDLWGARQALMDAVGFTPNDTQESASASQHLDALKLLIQNEMERLQVSNFTTQQISGTPVLYGVTYGLDYWTVVGTGANLFVSKDGRAFSTVSNPAGSSAMRAVHANSTHIVAVGDSNTLIYATDPNGTWTDNSSGIGSSGNLLSVWYGDGYWVCSDNDGYVYTASDPTGTWTQRSTPAVSGGEDITRVRYFDDLSIWVATGVRSGGYSGICTATNPTSTWTERTNPMSVDIDNLTWDGEYAIAQDGQFSYIRSSDGITWGGGGNLAPPHTESFDAFVCTDKGIGVGVDNDVIGVFPGMREGGSIDGVYANTDQAFTSSDIYAYYSPVADGGRIAIVCEDYITMSLRKV